MSKSNNDGLAFGRTLNGDHGKMGDDCHNYGSTFGCDDGCPQLRRGECPVPNENRHIIKDDEELEYLYNMN